MPFAFGLSGALASPLISARNAKALVRQARAGGVTLFDTAPAYGAGEGERRLGRTLKKDTNTFLMTKAGVTATGLARRVRDFSPASISASVDASLVRLNRTRIDLLWLHGPARSEITSGLVDTLHQLKVDGKVAHLGIAGRTEDVRVAFDHALFEAVMVPVNPLTPPPQRALVDAARAAGRLVFGIEALAGAKIVGATRGALWRGLQRATGRGARSASSNLSPLEALDWALTEGGADVIVSTTTSATRLASNLDALANRRL